MRPLSGRLVWETQANNGPTKQSGTSTGTVPGQLETGLVIMSNNTPAALMSLYAARAARATAMVATRVSHWAQLPNDDGMNSATITEGLELTKKLMYAAADIASAALWHDGRVIEADMLEDMESIADYCDDRADAYRGPHDN